MPAAQTRTYSREERTSRKKIVGKSFCQRTLSHTHIHFPSFKIHEVLLLFPVSRMSPNTLSKSKLTRCNCFSSKLHVQPAYFSKNIAAAAALIPSCQVTKYRAHRQMGMRRIFNHYASRPAYIMWKNRG